MSSWEICTYVGNIIWISRSVGIWEGIESNETGANIRPSNRAYAVHETRHTLYSTHKKHISTILFSLFRSFSSVSLFLNPAIGYCTK